MTTVIVERTDDVTRRAVTDTAPFALAVLPFGLAIGAASAAAGLSPAESLFGAVALLAGASQLAVVEVVGSGGSTVTAVLVVGLINLRFVLYGAGVARWFADAPVHHRMALAMPIIDQTFLLCQECFESVTDLDLRRRYYLTATALLASTFVASQGIAYHVGGSLPPSLGLHLAAPLAFAGMLAQAAKSSVDIVACAITGVVFVAGTGVLGAAALPVGVVVGVGAALMIEGNQR